MKLRQVFAAHYPSFGTMTCMPVHYEMSRSRKPVYSPARLFQYFHIAGDELGPGIPSDFWWTV